MKNLTLLDANHPQFPNPQTALTSPNGLLAVGGNLHPQTLLSAYELGIFPWFSEGEPLLWWSPDPRAVIFPDRLHVSRSLAKAHRQQRFQITFDKAFREVIAGCSAPRRDHDETWITPEMRDAYIELNRQGRAHSVEVWEDEMLVGGLYGIAVGAVFCGESMFSFSSNASKLALLELVTQVPELQLIDCQIPNPHLESLGAETLSRSEFLALLNKYKQHPVNWPSDSAGF